MTFELGKAVVGDVDQFGLCVVASRCAIEDPFRDGFAVATGPGAAGDDGNPGHQHPFVGAHLSLYLRVQAIIYVVLVASSKYAASCGATSGDDGDQAADPGRRMGVADVASVLVIPLLLEADLFEVPMRAPPRRPSPTSAAASTPVLACWRTPGVAGCGSTGPREGRPSVIAWCEAADGSGGRATCGGSPTRVYAGRPRRRGRRGNHGNGPRGRPDRIYAALCYEAGTMAAPCRSAMWLYPCQCSTHTGNPRTDLQHKAFGLS
jgi:hypothetical protein